MKIINLELYRKCLIEKKNYILYKIKKENTLSYLSTFRVTQIFYDLHFKNHILLLNNYVIIFEKIK